MSCAQPKTSNDYEDLFDGISLNGWKGDTALWSVKDSAIVGEIKPGKELERNSFIIWQGSTVRDFELIAEYRISDKGNSGFNYRSEEIPGLPFAMRGYQADIDGAKKYTGQNYEEQGRKILAFPGQKVRLPPVNGVIDDYAKKNIWTASEQLGELGNKDALKLVIKNNDWNELRILAKGNRLLHYINGVLISDVTDDDIQNRKMEGKLGFQVHVGPPMAIEVRRIRLKRL
ncbi:MAG: DUF1080 domain-containing protein [Niabella sp.]